MTTSTAIGTQRRRVSKDDVLPRLGITRKTYLYRRVRAMQILAELRDGGDTAA